MKILNKDRAIDWTIGSIVTLAVGNIALGIWGWYSGSLGTVCAFAAGHPAEVVSWTALFVLIGCLIGLAAMRAATSKKLATKDAKIAALKERPENKDGNGPAALTGEQALNFIRMLTDNQKEALAYFYEEGGSAEADPLNGELHALRRLGLMWMPDYSVPGMPATWTMPPNVYQIIRNHPDVLDGFLGGG